MSIEKQKQDPQVSLRMSGSIPVGEIIDERYRVLSLLGVGGFGSVYKVEQILLQRVYAMKTLNPVSMSDVTMMRLQKEAKAASRLDHPNLVKAIDFGFKDKVQPYMVMEYVNGQTLSEYLKNDGTLGVERALQFFIPLCFGMAYAHDQGVIHRDLKPSNIILRPDDQSASGFVPKILDFGIAKTEFGDDADGVSLTKTGEVFGTPLYMSPEQCNGQIVDGRTDIYAMGCVIFEALTGTPPFPGSSSLETMMHHQSSTAPSLREGSLGHKFPEPLENIISKMLAKKPEHRFQSFHQLVEELIRFQRGDSQKLAVMAPPATEKVEKAKTKQFQFVAGLLTGIAFGVAGMAMYTSTDLTKGLILPHTDQSAIVSDIRHDDYHTYMDDSIKSHSYYWSWKCVSLKENATPPSDAKVFLTLDPGEISSKDFDIKSRKYTGLSLEKLFAFDRSAYFPPTIVALKSQPQIRYLSMEGSASGDKRFKKLAYGLNHDILKLIGGLKNLRGLAVVRTIYETKRTDGTEIAMLPNLTKLRFMHLGITNTVSPVLKKIAGGPIRWLSVSAGDGLTHEDLQNIGTMKRLEVLSIHKVRNLNDATPHPPPEDTEYNALAELPNLRELSLDSYVAAKVIPAIRRCRKLQTLYVRTYLEDKTKDLGKQEESAKSDPLQAVIEHALPHVQVRHIIAAGLGSTDPDRSDPAEWLDLQKVPPESIGLYED